MPAAILERARSDAAPMQSPLTCPACGAPMEGPVGGFRFECRRCGCFRSTLPIAIDDDHVGDGGDEAAFDAAIAGTRERNFDVVLERLQRYVPAKGAAILEVGCAYGAFLAAAARRGYAAFGIEPDAARAARATRNVAEAGTVWAGYFPEDVPPGRRFHAIVFNDVFEHLPDPLGAARALPALLHERGVVAINLPNCKGIFFRVAEVLRRIGAPGPHDRLWQIGFPSPHLSYFHPDALARLLDRAGFRERERRDLQTLAIRELWPRLRYNNRMPVAALRLIWLAVVVASPLLAALPADVSLQIFDIRDDARASRRAASAS
ncbi:MAG TPA: class I SAM-dependent methyltransferase [Casimicrobiaceae bacterium]|nr:class I SAM-dependent methyltransferase [Casimicrobiaceae bacterium]